LGKEKPPWQPGEHVLYKELIQRREEEYGADPPPGEETEDQRNELYAGHWLPVEHNTPSVDAFFLAW